MTWMLLPINVMYGNEWKYLCSLLPLLFCWWSDDHAHTTFLFCWWRGCCTIISSIDRSNYRPLWCVSVIGHVLCNEGSTCLCLSDDVTTCVFRAKSEVLVPTLERKEGSRSENTKLRLWRLQDFSSVIHCETVSGFVSLRQVFPYSSTSFPEWLWEPGLPFCISLYCWF